MYAIDVARSFQAIMNLGIEKKADRDGQLLTDKDGTQKWTVQCAVVLQPNGRRNAAEVLKVGVASGKDLAAQVPVGPVELVNLRLGQFQNQDGQTQTYWVADDVRPAGGFPKPPAPQGEHK